MTAIETPVSDKIERAVTELFSTLVKLDSKCGELAEVRKAEIREYQANFQGENVTQARENARMGAAQFTQEAIDLQCDIDSLLRWKDYYTLLIQRGV